MPNGEFSPSRKTLLVLATPSPSVSRSSVMRFALGVPAPARLMTIFVIQPLMPLVSSGFGGGMVQVDGEGIDGHSIGGGRLAASRPTLSGGDIDRRYPGILRCRQGGRRPKGLFGGRGILRIVAGGEGKGERPDAHPQKNLLSHVCPSHMAVQYGELGNVHGLRYEIFCQSTNAAHVC